MTRPIGRVFRVVCMLIVGACSGELRLTTEGSGPLPDATIDDASADGDGARSLDTGAFLDGSDDALGETDDAEAGPCQKDTDCRLPSLHCDLIAGCVPCITDVHCPTKERKRCDASLHRCVECGITGDCATGFVCEPTTRKCIAGCTTGALCPGDARTCDASRGLCVACQSEAACVPKKHCELASGRCLECLVDGDCAAPRARCDVVVGRCVGCVTSADCPAKIPFCDPVPGSCVAG